MHSGRNFPRLARLWDEVSENRLRDILSVAQLPVQPFQIGIQRFLERRQILAPSTPPAPRLRFTFSQATSRFFRLFTLSTSEWTFLSPVGLSQ